MFPLFKLLSCLGGASLSGLGFKSGELGTSVVCFIHRFKLGLYLMSIEPVLAVVPSPIAAFNTFLLDDALTMVDFDTSAPLMAIEPVLAVESLPIAAFNTFLLDDALTIVDLSIFEPAANADPETSATKANAATDACNVFMGVSSVKLFWWSQFKRFGF